jgi:F0F1-type ATP synthase gamma subunit
MEEATKNAERLMEELKNLVQLSRRQAITQEMEELIVGSGLLKDENDFE